jgi:hypothetical protein
MEKYVVLQDGRPVKHGLSREQAEKHAAYLADGYLRHRANDKRRVAEFEVKVDKALMRDLDENWKALKRGDL